MKIFWKTITGVGVTLILIAIGISAWLAYLSMGKTDSFYLENASLDNPRYLYELQDRITKEGPFTVLHETPSVYAHRLKRGDGVIFAYRWFSEGSPVVIDDETFQKITIWLPRIPSERISEFDISDRMSVIVVFTRGGSAWPIRACSGYVNTGQLIIRKKRNRFIVRLNGTLSPLVVRRRGKRCATNTVAKEFKATALEYDDLTTWLGKPGTYPYAETYR
jgi:hypothetical protein